MTFNIPIWAIILVVLSPFIITFSVSLAIGLLKEAKRRKKIRKEMKEEESKRLDDLK